LERTRHGWHGASPLKRVFDGAGGAGSDEMARGEDQHPRAASRFVRCLAKLSEWRQGWELSHPLLNLAE
ncbi:MAG TPA: hypothetical protein VN648_30845, partial [Candidatus Methylomirabilis sp.]|nr:hypothetical protein [Candidatus Methylomirabilis sp.]